MRKLIPCVLSALLVSALGASPALGANAGADKMKACASAWDAMPADQKKATTYKQYSADCLSGKTALATPAAGKAATTQDRMKACASEWDKLKATGKTAGQTYQQFSANCLKN